VQLDLIDTASVDERAVEAPVVEDLCSRGGGNDDRVAVRDRAVVEMQAGGDSPTDVEHVLAQRNQQRLLGSLDLDVAPAPGRRAGHRT